MEHPDFLDKKYQDLAGSKSVERAVIKARRDPERKATPYTREERIQSYIDRIDKIVKTERGWELLRGKILKKFTIDTEDQDTITKIAHSLYQSEKRLAVEQGRGADVARLGEEPEENILSRYKELVHEKQNIQERSLSSWLVYLEKNDAHYPTWFRYFVVRNLEKMGTLDKGKGEYSKRTSNTIAPFPELNSEALGFVYRMLTTGIGNLEYRDNPKKREELEKLISRKDFIKLYTFAQVETAGSLNKESIRGEWVKYPQGSDYHILEDSLKGKGTGWCTAEGSASSHLQGGDFYVYYTLGSSGMYSEPRIAIRMQNGEIAEVRGVNHRQELEPILLDIAQEKYHSLPGGDKFDKKSVDMKKVTEIARKEEKGEPFTKDDLIFVYEINSTIEGFGYDKDPRVAELRSNRNVKEDTPVVFGCEPNQIAYNTSEITENTKAYIGKWTPEVLNLLPENTTHIYEEFPNKKVFLREIIFDPKIKNPQMAEKMLLEKGYQVSGWGRDILKKTKFSGEQKSIKLVSFCVGSLGFPNGATTREIFTRAQELGLELAPAEVGPQMRLQYEDQSMNEYLYIAMEQISDSNGDPSVFYVMRSADGTWLHASSAFPDSRWDADNRFVFVSRK